MERRTDPSRPNNEAYSQLAMEQNATISKMEIITERWDDLAGDEIEDTSYRLEDIGLSQDFSLD